MQVAQPVSLTTLVDDPSSPVIAVTGELDLASVEVARQELGALLNEPGRVTFDLTGLTFMDSSGIAFFVRVANEIGGVTLTHVNPMIRRVLQTTGLLEFFSLAD